MNQEILHCKYICLVKFILDLNKYNSWSKLTLRNEFEYFRLFYLKQKTVYNEEQQELLPRQERVRKEAF